MDLHAKIMNIKAKPYDGTDSYAHYCMGHRDARHEAADIANLADVELSELRDLVRGILENRDACFIPNDRDGLYGWDERASAILRTPNVQIEGRDALSASRSNAELGGTGDRLWD